MYFEVNNFHCNQPAPFTVQNYYKITANKIRTFSADPDTGWQTVVQNEVIQGDLDDVAIQVKSASGESGEVEIRFPDDKVFLKWSTKSSAEFKIEGTCSPGPYNTAVYKQVKFQNMTIRKGFVLKIDYCKSTYTV